MSNTEQLLHFQLQVIGGAFIKGFEHDTSNLNEEQIKALSTIAEVLLAFKRQSVK